MKKQLLLKDIRTDGKTQHRPVDDDVVKRYADQMKEGDIFPPVQIVVDGKENFLVDGFHRYFAVKKLRKKYIEAVVTNGTQRYARYLSFSANKDNGVPRPEGTIKNILLIIFEDEQWSKMSQHDIGRHVGCTQQFVSKVQAEFEKLSNNQLSDRTALSGPKTGFSRSDSVKVKRGSSEYEMKTPVKKVLDSTGKQVPEHLVKYFERSNEYRQMIKQLNTMLKAVRDGKEAGDLFYRYIKIENLTAEIGNVKRIFRFALPYAICRYCGADENNAECRACDGCGFVNEMTYKSTPKDLK